MNLRRYLLVFSFLLVSSLSFGQSRMSFHDIPLGTDYKTFVRQMKVKGFTMHLEREEDLPFYGNCKEGFLEGTVDGNPAAVHLSASCKSQKVFQVEVALREFIDQEEALEEANRLIPALCGKFDYFTSEEYCPTISALIEMPGGPKHITRYMCHPVGGIRIFYYASQGKVDSQEPFGCLVVVVYNNPLSDEHIVVLTYYDYASEREAEDEYRRSQQ